jgi:hypothetical protein
MNFNRFLTKENRSSGGDSAEFAVSRPRPRSIPRRFWQNRDGVSSVEFAVCAFAFFVLLLGTLEYALIFFFQNSLTNAVYDAANEIRTEPVGSGIIDAPSMVTAVCGESQLPNCANILKVSVQNSAAASSFSTLPAPPACTTSMASVYPSPEPPGCSVLVIKVCYPWQVFDPLGYIWAHGTTYELNVGTVIQTEPQATTCGAPS